MNSMSRMSRWAQLMGNVGVLLGLILVGVQIKQNTDAITAQIFTASHESSLQLEYTMLGENAAHVWAKSIESPRDLTLAELRIIEAYIWAEVSRWRFSYEMGAAGYVANDEWQILVNKQAFFFLGNPYGRSWWRALKSSQTNLPPELIYLVDKNLEILDAGTAEWFSKIVEGIEE